MLVMFPVVAAVILVAAGYAVLWSSYQPNLPKNVSVFGKALSAVILVMAGLLLACRIACLAGLRIPCCPLAACRPVGNECARPGKMHFRAGMKEPSSGTPRSGEYACEGARDSCNYDRIISDYEKKKAMKAAEQK